MTTAITKTESQLPALMPPAQVAKMLEQVIIKGNLNVMNPADKVRYYQQVCGVIGIPVELRPFEFISMQGKEVLYVLRSCTEWLRDQRGIACKVASRKQIPGDLYEVVVEVMDRTGRQDFASGLVSVKGLAGENLANAIMKAETKAKRRATLSISGLGMLDESEVDHPGRSVAAVLSENTDDAAPLEFKPWADSTIPPGAKRVLGAVTSARETIDKTGSLVRAMIAIEGDGGTIEVATRDMGAFAALECATATKGLYCIQFVQIDADKPRKLVSITEPPSPGPEVDPDTGKPLLF